MRENRDKKTCDWCGLTGLIFTRVRLPKGVWKFQLWDSLDQKHKCWISY